MPERLEDIDYLIEHVKQREVIHFAAREWSRARQACMGVKEVTADQYDRLARAEAALQAAVLAQS